MACIGLALFSLVMLGCTFDVVEKKYTVMLAMQDGTGGSTSVTATFDSAMPTAAAPTRTGYVFDGYHDTPNGGGTQYYSSTMTSVRTWDKAEDATLFASWRYPIGSRGPAGGLIFYDDVIGYDVDGNGSIETGEKHLFTGILEGKRYLEAAPVSTEMTGTPWNGKDSCLTDTAIDTGANNTLIILEELTDGNNIAKQCAVLSHEGYSDWFLPSKDELNLMYINLKDKGLGMFSDKTYWSSSGIKENLVIAQSFKSGIQGNYYKINSNYVRLVSSF